MRAVERREAAARLSMVEAFYGDDNRLLYNTAIAHTAAEHTRAALRVAAPLVGTAASATARPHSSAQQRQQQRRQAEDHEPLFMWLGIVEPPPPTFWTTGGAVEPPQEGTGAEGEGEDEDEWVLPFADAEIEHLFMEVIPAPSTLWRPWPTGRHAPARPIASRRSPGQASRMPDPATRRTSAMETFGTILIRREIERWVAGSDARQVHLRRLMVSALLQTTVPVIRFCIYSS